MRALTLKQPMASAIIAGPKRVENRQRRTVPLTWDLPVWVAIHAGKGWWFDGLYDPDVAEHGMRVLWPEAPARADAPRGALLGVARIDRVGPYRDMERVPRGTLTEESLRQLGLIGDPWAFGPWCIEIGDVVALDEPIKYVRGMLGFWRVADDHAAQLRALVPEGGRVAP